MNRKQLLYGMIFLSCLCLIWATPAPCFSSQADQEHPTQTAAESRKKSDIQNFQWPIIRTYTLKHVKPEAVLSVTKFYLVDASSFDNIITVKLYEQNLPKFEEMLNKLDVEKKTIQFQVFAIVASRGRVEEKKNKEGQETSAGDLTKTVGPAAAKPITSMDFPPKYTGKPVSLKFKQTDLRDVILYLAEFAGLNVIFDPDVQGTVTCDLKDIPWDQALDIVLMQNKMGKVIEGKILRVARIRALSPEKSDAIENKDLKRVLDELKTLWNFKTYEVDGPSFVTVREDTEPNNFKLVTNRALNLVVSNVKVIGDEPGKRIVSIEQLKLTGMMNFADYVFVDTHDVTLKENGFLVAGVSGYGSASNALILVINAEIK
jgi:type II secretory pathway component GspD/PulD (secretin)